MMLRTERLVIRSLEPADGRSFAEMARDGSLKDVGFDEGCGRWIDSWIVEARELTDKDDPTIDYLAYAVQLNGVKAPIGAVGCSYYKDLDKIGITYFIGAQHRRMGYATEAIKAYIQYFFRHYTMAELIATVREENIPSWKVAEAAGFHLSERKMYQDINDAAPEMYRFYSITGADAPAI